jgi:hypothetical protein
MTSDENMTGSCFEKRIGMKIFWEDGECKEDVA